MIESVKAIFDILFGVAGSDSRWFIVACFWLILALGVVSYTVRYFKKHYESRILSLELAQGKCDEALAQCKIESERRDHTIASMERMITAMNSGYSVLRGYMMAKGMMDSNADSLILAEMNKIIRDKGT